MAPRKNRKTGKASRKTERKGRKPAKGARRKTESSPSGTRHIVPGEDVSIRSFLIHGKFRTEAWDYSHHVVPPISSTSTYRLDSAERGAMGFYDFADPLKSKFEKSPIFIYERLDEPTRSMLEEDLATAEGGEMALCFSSGMGAIASTLLAILQTGDEVIAHETLYGCTFSLLNNWFPRWGISVKYVDLVRNPDPTPYFSQRTRVVYFETPVNPNLEIVDIAAVVKAVKAENRKRRDKGKIKTIVDNTFASPACQRPLGMGVDLVVHSLTKSISGFGTELAGAVVGPKNMESDIILARKDLGTPLSSKSAWAILVYGLPTLDLRMRRAEKTAMAVARFLEGHPKVEKVFYPGLPSFPWKKIARAQMRGFDGKFAPGSMIYFTTVGYRKKPGEASCKFVNTLAREAYSITLAVSLGQIRTLIEKPGSMTHAVVPPEVQAAGGIDAEGIRLAIGLEEPEDLIRDLERALAKI